MEQAANAAPSDSGGGNRAGSLLEGPAPATPRIFGRKNLYSCAWRPGPSFSKEQVLRSGWNNGYTVNRGSGAVSLDTAN
jgi:hypothetical protein